MIVNSYFVLSCNTQLGGLVIHLKNLQYKFIYLSQPLPSKLVATFSFWFTVIFVLSILIA